MGLGPVLCSTTKRLIAVDRSTTETKTRASIAVCFAKRLSTALNHEHQVGVKLDEALVSIEPSSHVGILVGGVVVEDHMHGVTRRHLRLDRVEEANKVLMTMALHIASDHGVPSISLRAANSIVVPWRW
jgi:hypothetical protein